MARWDEILSLPVQNPPTLEFSAADLVWSKIEGWRDNIDRLALIPFARVDDFVRGESANKDCPTRFHVEARRRRPPQTSLKQKVDGILEYILYWCSFGPDDHRKGGIVRPSRSTYVPKKKNAGRPNTKRGCTCHFIVKRLIAEPSVALVIYNQDKHVDKKGLPCHGPQDKKAEGTRAMFAPYISEDLRLRVLSLLYVGVSVETIMQRHNESVERQGGPCNRDDLLTHRYVRRQERSIRRSTYELDMDDAVSISMWVESHQSHVFFYDDFSDSDPFILGIQTEWQLQQMIRFGNRGLLASDSRFGTNKLKYPVHSLVVFNSEKKSIPVAWIITPRFATADAHRWMRALYNRVRTKDPTWRLAGFIVDDPSTDILTIRDVFQCSILISFWRVRHLWHKNIVKRCSDTEMRVQMLRRLEEVVDDTCRGRGTIDSFEVFMEDFVDGSDFIDYFKAVWYPRIGVWITALKAIPLASQETSAAMELYHNQLKVRLLNEKDPGVYQRADWLVDKLGTKVHSYFWLDEYSEKDDFARYWKDEWDSGLTAWRKALKIADHDVVIEGRRAKVTDQLDRDRVHVVWNPGSEFAICDCNWAEMGYLCEHIFKFIRMCSKKRNRIQSISLFQYNQALIDMLHCPPHDSLIRDHAVSLAIAVQKQLCSLVDLDSCHINEDSARNQAADKCEHRTVRVEPCNHDRESVKKNHFMGKDVSSHDKNDLEDGHEDPGTVMGTSGESLREETTCTEMDIDPSSSCIPPLKSLSVQQSANYVVFMENGDRLTNDTIHNNKSPPSKDDGLTNQAGLECNSLQAAEPTSTNNHRLPEELINQCTANQNDDHHKDSGPSFIINTADADISSDKLSSLNKTVEQQKSEANSASHDRESAKKSRLIDEYVSSHDQNDHGDASEGRGSIAGDFGESIREETSCTDMDIDPSSKCIPPPPESLSANQNAIDDVFVEKGDNNKSPPSKDGLTYQGGPEYDSMKNFELCSPEKQCPTSQNDDNNNDSEPPAISNTADADKISDKTTSLTKSVEHQPIGVVDNEMARSESERRSKTENQYSTNVVHNKKMNNSDCDHDSSAVDSMPESKSLVNSSPMQNHCDKQSPIEAAAQGKDSVLETSLGDKSNLRGYTPEEVATECKSDSKRSDNVNGIVAESTDFGDGNTIVEKEASDSCHMVVGVEASK